MVIFPQDNVAKRYVNSAQTRLESILADTGVTILDQKKAASLKNVWKKLEDPGYFITAEDFVKNAGKYEIDGVMRVYLHAESTKTVGQFFSATALADMRLVDEEAQAKSFVTVPMGVPGRPPSDGLTESAALTNAVQRAIDEAAGNVGLQVMDYTNPKLPRARCIGSVGLACVTLPCPPNAVPLSRERRAPVLAKESNPSRYSSAAADGMDSSCRCGIIVPYNNGLLRATARRSPYGAYEHRRRSRKVGLSDRDLTSCRTRRRGAASHA